MSMIVVGLISGTSADGIDAALVEINKGSDLKIRLIDFETYPYPVGLMEQIIDLPFGSDIGNISYLNFYIGELFADAALMIAKKGGIGMPKIDLIGSHGQTVYHMPKIKREKGKEIRSTLQIGEPSVIAERTGVTTVADFRPRDMAAGGEGAPLTPYLHYHLFSDKISRLIINIGGMANITYLAGGGRISDATAFDTGPGNVMIDQVYRICFRSKAGIDHGGETASKGSVSKELLRSLMRHPFIKKDPPKTTGREEFGRVLADKVLKMAKVLGLNRYDLLATVTAFTAESIIYNSRGFVKKGLDEVIVGGGGTRNTHLMRSLQKGFHPVKVSIFEDHKISSRAIEAMAFALLAYETIHGRPNNLPGVTGAKRPVIMGKVIPGSTSRPFPYIRP